VTEFSNKAISSSCRVQQQQQQQAAASSSKQQQAAASSSKQQQAAASSSKQQQAASSKQQTAVAAEVQLADPLATFYEFHFVRSAVVVNHFSVATCWPLQRLRCRHLFCSPCELSF
jgi:hypothetical protein